VSGARGELDKTFDEVLVALFRNKRSIALFAMAGGALLLSVSFLVPSRYESRVTLLPATEDARANVFAQLTSSFSGLVPDAAVLGAAPAAIPEIAKSRSILEALLDRTLPTDGRKTLLDLIEPNGNGLTRRERAVKQLRDDIDVGVDRRTGIVEIRVEAGSPRIASWMANSADTLLQNFLLEMFTTRATAKRRFIESRIVDTSSRLAQAENALETFRVGNVSIGNSARLQMEEARLRRNVREQEEVYLTLKREFELARVDEHRTMPSLNLIDPGYPPATRKWPVRSFFLLGGFLVGAAIACIRAVRVGSSAVRTVHQE